mmetsp:Transcript_11602/g.25057  ORF Transcript_11602/g.25057 Transcript_11602/m.25057 type:complete len:122 (-) Transcript_11602:176-541(-)
MAAATLISLIFFVVSFTCVSSAFIRSAWLRKKKKHITKKAALQGMEVKKIPTTTSDLEVVRRCLEKRNESFDEWLKTLNVATLTKIAELVRESNKNLYGEHLLNRLVELTPEMEKIKVLRK